MEGLFGAPSRFQELLELAAAERSPSGTSGVAPDARRAPCAPEACRPFETLGPSGALQSLDPAGALRSAARGLRASTLRQRLRVWDRLEKICLLTYG